eukprot:351361-Chlamydomonas_euryale.AAC.3
MHLMLAWRRAPAGTVGLSPGGAAGNGWMLGSTSGACNGSNLILFPASFTMSAGGQSPGGPSMPLLYSADVQLPGSPANGAFNPGGNGNPFLGNPWQLPVPVHAPFPASSPRIKADDSFACQSPGSTPGFMYTQPMMYYPSTSFYHSMPASPAAQQQTTVLGVPLPCRSTQEAAAAGVAEPPAGAPAGEQPFTPTDSPLGSPKRTAEHSHCVEASSLAEQHQEGLAPAGGCRGSPDRRLNPAAPAWTCTSPGWHAGQETPQEAIGAGAQAGQVPDSAGEVNPEDDSDPNMEQIMDAQQKHAETPLKPPGSSQDERASKQTIAGRDGHEHDGHEQLNEKQQLLSVQQQAPVSTDEGAMSEADCSAETSAATCSVPADRVQGAEHDGSFIAEELNMASLPSSETCQVPSACMLLAAAQNVPAEHKGSASREKADAAAASRKGGLCVSDGAPTHTAVDAVSPAAGPTTPARLH